MRDRLGDSDLTKLEKHCKNMVSEANLMAGYARAVQTLATCYQSEAVIDDILGKIQTINGQCISIQLHMQCINDIIYGRNGDE